MVQTQISRRRRAGRSRRPAESPARKTRDNWVVITNPYDLLLRRFTDRQFNIILAHLPDTPAHLVVEGRFLAAAQLAYPKLTVRYLVLGTCRPRPSSATEWWWNTLPCAKQQFVAAQEVIRRMCALDEVCSPACKAA